MRDVAAWLGGRSPSPPADLARALASVSGPGTIAETLVAEGTARLTAARSRLGRARESAFRLLEADALFTYACEAALEHDDPETALRRVLSAAR